jgi:hypothetical protein
MKLKERSGEDLSRIFVWTSVKKAGWPTDTLNKFQNLVDANKGEWLEINSGKEGKTQMLPYSSFDFAYMTDADQEFRRNVCEDILGTRVGERHFRIPRVA